jgi:hypothetical protein
MSLALEALDLNDDTELTPEGVAVATVTSDDDGEYRERSDEELADLLAEFDLHAEE